MDPKQKNPLTKFFRQPAIFVQLPSDGKWWPDDSLAMTENKELPVFPMSAKDEIILKTPDALMNGQGIVETIQSCVPNIKNAWQMPSVDLDAILIAIRIATYGNKMSFDSKCAHCSENNSHEINLGTPLAEIHCPDYEKPIDYQELKIKLKPQPYFELNKMNMINYEEQKIMQAVSNPDLDDEVKATQINASVKRMIDIGIKACTNSTEFIELPGGAKVSDKKFLEEFYSNAELDVIRHIQQRITELTQASKLKPLNLMCESCNREYQAELTFDFSNFFATGF